MKRFLGLFLAGAVSVSLAACGSVEPASDTTVGTEATEEQSLTENTVEEIEEVSSESAETAEEESSGFTEARLDGYTTVYHLGKGAEVLAEFATGNLTSEVQPDSATLEEMYASNGELTRKYFTEVVVLRNNNDYPVVFNGKLSTYKDGEVIEDEIDSFDEYGYVEAGETGALLFQVQRNEVDEFDSIEVTVGFTQPTAIMDLKTYDMDREVETYTYKYEYKGTEYVRSFFSFGIDSSNYNSTRAIVIQRYGDIAGAAILSYNSNDFAACSSIAETGLFDNYVVIPMTKFGDTQDDVGEDIGTTGIASIDEWFAENGVENVEQMESKTTYTLEDVLAGL